MRAQIAEATEFEVWGSGRDGDRGGAAVRAVERHLQLDHCPRTLQSCSDRNPIRITHPNHAQITHTARRSSGPRTVQVAGP
eukprot:1639725-Rhodomonas_salina.1